MSKVDEILDRLTQIEKNQKVNEYLIQKYNRDVRAIIDELSINFASRIERTSINVMNQFLDKIVKEDIEDYKDSLRDYVEIHESFKDLPKQIANEIYNILNKI